MDNRKQVLCLDQLPHYTNLVKEYARNVSSLIDINRIYSARSVCTFNDDCTLAITCVQLPIHIDSSKILVQSVTIQGGSVDYKDKFVVQTNSDELGFIIVCSDMQILKKTIGKTLNIKFKIS